MDTEAFSKRQIALLEHEELIIEFERSEAEAIIEFDKSEGKYEFWVSEQIVASGYELSDLLNSLKTGLQRGASFQRKTNETDISISLNLDGKGSSSINTGLKFFDHMLEQIARHGLVDLNISCDGDLEVDEHHTVEDVAIALGETLIKALGDKKGIERYAFVLPMDEAQATVALDLSGRPYLVFEGEFNREYVGDLPTEMVKHFFYSLAMSLKATLHISFDGENDHHKIEACFKGFARTLKSAVERNLRTMDQIPSSKGAL
ncbi:MAG: imidazoleglycerol-phosphate dehydratase HisB [Balneola sp.]|nr:MAG: imidazoleglycerol-phosphate dehydratase HisB [Balneola sp.]